MCQWIKDIHTRTHSAWIRNLSTTRNDMIYRANSLDSLRPSADFSPCTFGNQSFSSLESETWRDICEYPTLSLSAASPWSGRWIKGQMVSLWVFRGKTENVVSA